MQNVFILSQQSQKSDIIAASTLKSHLNVIQIRYEWDSRYNSLWGKLLSSSECGKQDKFNSVQFSHSVTSDSLQPHEPKHTSPTPGVHPNLCPLCSWCHPIISSSVIPFFSCPQSFPASGFFQMSQLFASGGQSIGVSASTSALPMNTQGWSPLGWTGGSPCSPRDSQESSPTPQFRSINSSVLSFL